ncbi:MAG: FixH family protein [Myxococcota bacterium]|nr:FixH family protein [Myxococcota bacterium]
MTFLPLRHPFSTDRLCGHGVRVPARGIAWRAFVFAFAAALSSAAFGCGSRHESLPSAPEAGTAGYLSRDDLLDPQACQGCHPNHYGDWQRSMHAYAADDPVFVAMNQRGQRETNGKLGTFCVKCHAPMAVRDGQTTDGMNLASLPPKYKGVTCFFCHSEASVEGTHNAALTLSGDLAMRGEVSNPIANGVHAGMYSTLHDRDRLESARACGTCHDVVVDGTNAFIERTSCEWSHSAFNAPLAQGGQTCVQCHMVESEGAIAQFPNAPIRKYHTHDFPAVDIPIGANEADGGVARATVQQFLASSLQGGLCVTRAGGVRAILDPVFLGHDWPSGTAQDRRAWAEIVAYNGGAVIYQSGVVPDGTPVVGLPNDPDLWLLRDSMFDGQGNPVDMFWQAASSKTNAIPALATFDPLDMRYYQTHVEQLYPRSGATPMSLPQMPDRVTFRMRLQPVGLDVLESLVGSGDLAPSVPSQMPTFDVSFLSPDGGTQAALEWTPAAATLTYRDEYDFTTATCVATSGFNVGATKVRAPAPAAPKDCPSAALPDGDGGAADAATVVEAAAQPAVALDASAECDPRYHPDTIEPGLTKTGNGGALTLVLLSAAPSPPGVNYNTWVVKVLDSNGKPVTDATFPEIKTWMPLHGHPSSIVPTSVSNGDGTYTLKLYLFMPGLWQITPTVQAGLTKDQAVFTFCVGG